MTRNHWIFLLAASALLLGGFGVIVSSQHAKIVANAASDSVVSTTESPPKTILAGNYPNSTKQDGSLDQAQNSPSSSDQASGFTMTDVEAHGSKDSCWSTINGSVYDLTSWIPQHPGGAFRIIAICGRDGTRDYEAQHGRSRMVQRTLAMFKIGELSS